jgi:hypothetical protein
MKKPGWRSNANRAVAQPPHTHRRREAMSKPKVTPAPPGPQEEQTPRTIPLSDITITWPPLRDFEGEPEKPITPSGKRLGAIVAWMARTAPGALTTEDTWARDAVHLDLKGLAEILRGLAHSSVDVDGSPAMLNLLATMANDMAARLAAADDIATDFKGAVATIAAPPAEAK